jgi:hypothetical protein
METFKEKLEELHENGIGDYYLSYYMKTIGYIVRREKLRDVRQGKIDLKAFNHTAIAIDKVYEQWKEGQEI